MEKRFHAHIYFEPKDLEGARSLAERARTINQFQFVTLSEIPIGPHPMGMIEIHFSEPSQSVAIDWIKNNRGSFSVLIHQDTGDDVKDHTENIQWLGPTVPLDFSFFELIRRRPDLRVHK